MNIRKIIREEIDDDFGWIKEIPAFLPGKGFDEDMICYSEAEDCTVKILEDRIIFSLDVDKFVNKWSGYDNEWILPALFNNAMNGRLYDGNGDYHEFDSEEFNYSGGHVPDRLRERAADLMVQINSDLDKKEVLDWFYDVLLNFEDYMRYPTLIKYFNNLVDEVLSALGYAVQENRWLSISEEFHRRIEELESKGIDVEVERVYGGKELVITVPMEVVNKIHRDKQFKDLSGLFQYVMTPITDVGWYDWFYEEWSTSGASDEITESWARFLDNAEDFMESDEGEEERKFIEYCYDLLGSNGWSIAEGRQNTFKKPIPNRGKSVYYLSIALYMYPYNIPHNGIQATLWPSWGSSWRDGKKINIPYTDNDVYKTFEKFLDVVEEKSKELLKLPPPPSSGVARF